jgi:hypothetical protein
MRTRVVTVRTLDSRSSKPEATWAAFREAVVASELEVTPRTKLWFVICEVRAADKVQEELTQVAIVTTPMPMRLDTRTRAASCHRMPTRTIFRPLDRALDDES